MCVFTVADVSVGDVRGCRPGPASGKANIPSRHLGLASDALVRDNAAAAAHRATVAMISERVWA